MYKIIDIHTHAYPEDIAEKAAAALGAFYNIDIKGRGTYADLEEQANEAGVCGFLLFSVATKARQVPKVNDFVARLTKLSQKNGFQTHGFACMHQDYPDFAGEIERCTKLGLRGVKIHPDIQRMDICGERMYELCEIIEGRLPLYLHMGDERPENRYSEPKKLARLLDRFPRLIVAAAHLGGYRAWEEAEEYLYGHPNIWYDISSVLWDMSAERATRLVEKCGADRVMFGTDYPVVRLADYIEMFLALNLTERQREDIFYNNAVRFLSGL